MCFKISFQDLFLTTLAFVELSMSPGMIFTLFLSHESLWTVFAYKFQLQCFSSVSLKNMSVTIMFGSKLLFAKLALVGFFSSVSSNMYVAFPLGHELLFAKLAFVGFFSSVSTNMAFTIALLRKPFWTKLAFERFSLNFTIFRFRHVVTESGFAANIIT